MTQTNLVIDAIRAVAPHVEFEIRQSTSIADRDRVSEFHQFGRTGVFTSDHEDQLLRGEVDFVVHSLKDLPTTIPDGLVLAAVPPREDTRDALCGATLDRLRQGARVGTGSLRRRAQMLSLRPDVEIVPIRGNVGPRLAKIEGEDGLDAVILASAGLNRLGFDAATTEILDPELFPYAVGQGALGIEARGTDAAILDILREIECRRTRAEVDAERAMMHALGAGCSLPVGAHIRWTEDRLVLTAQVTAVDGSERIGGRGEAARADAEAAGLACAAEIKAAGGTRLLETSFREFGTQFRQLPQ